jgi:hypothetical protein
MGGDCQRPLVEAVPSPLDGGATHHYTLLAKDVGARVNRLAAEADLLQSLASEQSAGDVYREGDATAKDAVALRSHLLTKVWWFADLLQVLTPSKPPVQTAYLTGAGFFDLRQELSGERAVPPCRTHTASVGRVRAW